VTPPVRVVLAEDSVTARELLLRLLTSDPGIDVVGCATNGLEAVDMTVRLRPALVVMDIDMPLLDGFEATRRIMTECPTPIIIVTATRHVEDVELSLEAVRHGALALLAKPGWPGSANAGIAPERLLSNVKALAEVRVVRLMTLGRPGPDAGPEHPAPIPLSGAAAGLRRGADAAVIDIVGVAASTGGPPALAGLLGALPVGFPAPLLVVQHLPPGFSQGFASWLGSQSPFPVRLAGDRDELLGGTVYVAPEGVHLEVAGNQVRLRAGSSIEGYRPAADRLFRSLADHGRRAAIVVLTGMGKDGLAGAQAVRRAGGKILAQDRTSSIVFGMPGAVVAAGLADVEGPVDVLAASLAALTDQGTQV